MALSVSITFFFVVTLSVSLWVRVQYTQALISKRRTHLLIQAFRPKEALPAQPEAPVIILV
jgi:hypothetical protein